jgi:hypothetical protein
MLTKMGKVEAITHDMTIVHATVNSLRSSMAAIKAGVTATPAPSSGKHSSCILNENEWPRLDKQSSATQLSRDVASGCNPSTVYMRKSTVDTMGKTTTVTNTALDINKRTLIDNNGLFGLSYNRWSVSASIQKPCPET